MTQYIVLFASLVVLGLVIARVRVERALRDKMKRAVGDLVIMGRLARKEAEKGGDDTALWTTRAEAYERSAAVANYALHNGRMRPVIAKEAHEAADDLLGTATDRETP